MSLGVYRGLIIVERWDYLVSPVWNKPYMIANVHQFPRFKSVATAYRGFDGELWPDGENAEPDAWRWESHYVEKDGNISPIEDYPEVYAEFCKLREECSYKKKYDLLYVSITEAGEHAKAGSKNELPMTLLGYDCGNIDECTDGFSCIINEIVFGVYEELVQYASRLNEHFLFQTYQDAADFLDQRNRLQQEGGNFEEYDRIDIIRVLYINETRNISR